jgi:hypothetical protein
VIREKGTRCMNLSMNLMCVSNNANTVNAGASVRQAADLRAVRSAAADRAFMHSNGSEMTTQPLETDYLIVGAGAVGMAFADVLVRETKAQVAIVDRHDQPGGHWNDAYPFIRLHGPSSMYGVNSRRLGSDDIDDRGLNKGLYERASCSDLLSYFDQVMQKELLGSGRVEYFPMCHYDRQQLLTSLVSGERRRVTVRKKIVDTTYFETAVPSTHPPRYALTADIQCVPPNELSRIGHPYREYIVIGAGKTGIDTCLWLLERGVSPEQISWIRPHDSWLLNRANLQLRGRYFEATLRSMTDQLEALLEASSIDNLFARLEARGQLLRIDDTVAPTVYRCATVTRAELEQLKRIRNVIRLGRVREIRRNKMVLERGSVATGPDVLHIDCSSTGVPNPPARPIFQNNVITPQLVRTCQPAFSAAFVAHVEAAYEDEGEKNQICTVVPTPAIATDWLRMLAVTLINQYRWSQAPDLDNWIAKSRVDGGLAAGVRSLKATDVEAHALLKRYRAAVGTSIRKLEELLSDAGDPLSASRPPPVPS